MFNPQERDLVESLRQDERVRVVDPFAGRAYDATVTIRRESYQQGALQQYFIEIRERDEAPRYQQIEINGQAFVVQKHTEEVLEGDYVMWNAVLRLNKTELASLRNMFRLDAPVEVRRVGIDSTPEPRRIGGARYWSEHEERGRMYYKQNLHLIPMDYHSSDSRIFAASYTEQQSLTEMVVALQARFESLVDELTSSGVLPSERRDALLHEDWTMLHSSDRIDTLNRQTLRVSDAEEEL